MRIASGVTDQVIYFVAVDSTDLKTRETGLSSFTVYRSRNGGSATAFTTPTVTEVSAANMPGVYKLLLDEDMTIDSGDEEQEMIFHITQASMAPVTRVITIFRPKITAGETLNVASGVGDAVLTADIRVKKNTALAAFPFRMTDSADHISPKTGLTVTCQISKDGGAFAGATNSVTEISNGWYKISFTAGDLNADTIALKFTATGADQLDATIITQTD